VNVLLLPSSLSAGSGEPCQFLTSFLLNGTVALDAGSLGLYGTPSEQARVKHVFLSHSHIDHLATLPVFLENAYEGRADAVTVHGSEAVLACLRTDLLNERVWPDLLLLSRPETPFLRLEALAPGKAVEVEGLRVTPVPVDHTVPTLGFVVEDGSAAVVFSSDTGPTEDLWRAANALPHLRAVFLEVTFPDSLHALAAVSKHHTPATFGREVAKLRRPVPVYAIHLKPRYHARVEQELHDLGLPQVSVARSGAPYSF
jgi:ribonuclease BN (tRNA processing enzyme)